MLLWRKSSKSDSLVRLAAITVIKAFQEYIRYKQFSEITHAAHYRFI